MYYTWIASRTPSPLPPLPPKVQRRKDKKLANQVFIWHQVVWRYKLESTKMQGIWSMCSWNRSSRHFSENVWKMCTLVKLENPWPCLWTFQASDLETSAPSSRSRQCSIFRVFLTQKLNFSSYIVIVISTPFSRILVLLVV